MKFRVNISLGRPGRLQQAEASLGEGARPRTALLALQRARSLTRLVMATRCQQVLEEVGRALAY